MTAGRRMLAVASARRRVSPVRFAFRLGTIRRRIHWFGRVLPSCYAVRS